MRKLNSREKFGIGLLLVLAAVVAFSLRGDGLGFGGSSAAEPEELAPLGQAPVVRMDLLTLDAAEYDAKGRNLFSYYTPPPPARETRPVERDPAPPPIERPTPPPRRKPLTNPIERLPRPKFQYIGFIGPKEAKIACFDVDGVVELAALGEVVQEEFRVVEFKYEAVVMGFVDEKYQGKTTELKKGSKGN